MNNKAFSNFNITLIILFVITLIIGFFYSLITNNFVVVKNLYKSLDDFVYYENINQKIYSSLIDNYIYNINNQYMFNYDYDIINPITNKCTLNKTDIYTEYNCYKESFINIDTNETNTRLIIYVNDKEFYNDIIKGTLNIETPDYNEFGLNIIKIKTQSPINFNIVYSELISADFKFNLKKYTKTFHIKRGDL